MNDINLTYYAFMDLERISDFLITLLRKIDIRKKFNKFVGRKGNKQLETSYAPAYAKPGHSQRGIEQFLFIHFEV